MIGPLNISAIEKSLLRVKQEFQTINQSLADKRDPLSYEVVNHMVDGYRALNDYFVAGLNPFELGQSSSMLELNQIVLCGYNEQMILSLREQLRQNGKTGTDEPLLAVDSMDDRYMRASCGYFYSDDGCLREMMEWFDINHNKSVWFQAAGLLGQILSHPQLFVEGNHRTATLLMSYLLVSQGKPPCVLTPEAAIFYFEHASDLKKKYKGRIDTRLQLPRLAEQFADWLATNCNDAFLL